MTNLYRVIKTLCVGIAVGITCFLLSTPVSAAAEVPLPQPTQQVTAPIQQPITTTSAREPNVFEEFGPPGVLITTVLTGILMIVKAVNEGKHIDVATYKERAKDAESHANEEIGKVHKKLQELEGKLDEVLKDRDEYRDALEDRKAYFTQQILDMEKRHQKELEDMHAALMIEVHTRHRLERLLLENGIQIPETPPPYTKQMKNDVTAADAKEAKEAVQQTAELRIIDPNEK